MNPRSHFCGASGWSSRCFYTNWWTLAIFTGFLLNCFIPRCRKKLLSFPLRYSSKIYGDQFAGVYFWNWFLFKLRKFIILLYNFSFDLSKECCSTYVHAKFWEGTIFAKMLEILEIYDAFDAKNSQFLILAQPKML